MEPLSPAGPPTGGRDRRPLLVENVYEKESSESYIERHFRNRGLHRCRTVAEFDTDVIAVEFGPRLLRSIQEVESNPDGKGLRPVWTMLLFQVDTCLFWHFHYKSPNGYGEDRTKRSFTLTVFADTASRAAAEAVMLESKYTVRDNDGIPGFFMVRDTGNPRRIPIRQEYALTPSQLDLHYGTGFAEWAERFVKGLPQNGLSILRGKPGTGKTSFLRHLICTLGDTHRFYYVPVDAFGLLQTQMTGFLAKERKRFPEAHLVLVLEDAEQLLLNRREFRDGLASSLLNFTDGFVGDLVRAHLICTINSEVKDLDEAVLRPGRQRFFREFDLLKWEQATALAESMGVELTEKRSYSLAEIYHFKDTLEISRLKSEESRPIGFGTF